MLNPSDLHKFTKKASLLSTVMTHAPLIRATGQTLKTHGPYINARVKNMTQPIVNRMPNKIKQIGESLAKKTQNIGAKSIQSIQRANEKIQVRIPKPIGALKNHYSNMQSYALDQWGMSL